MNRRVYPINRDTSLIFTEINKSTVTLAVMGDKDAQTISMPVRFASLLETAVRMMAKGKAA